MYKNITKDTFPVHLFFVSFGPHIELVLFCALATDNQPRPQGSPRGSHDEPGDEVDRHFGLFMTTMHRRLFVFTASFRKID